MPGVGVRLGWPQRWSRPETAPGARRAPGPLWGGGSAAGAARGARPDPRARRGARVRRGPLGAQPRRGARAVRGRAAPRPRGLLRRRDGRARVRHLPHRRLLRRGRAHADRALHEHRPARGVGGSAAPERPAAGRCALAARHAPGDPAPAAGRSHLPPPWPACPPSRWTAGSQGWPPDSAPATRATPTTSRFPGTRRSGNVRLASPGWWPRSLATKASA